MFFAMSAHALLAEYYAETGQPFQSSVGSSEYLQPDKKNHRPYRPEPRTPLPCRPYTNYFREKYPERHPIYHSLIWLFKEGDKAKGLKQLDGSVCIRAE